MPTSAKAYIAVVIGAGATSLLAAMVYWRSESLTNFAIFLGLSVAAAMLKFRVPGITGTYSPVFVFALLGAATLSFSEVIVTFEVAGIVQSIFRAKRPPSFVQVCFNASNLALSAWAGLLIVQGQIPVLGQQPLMLGLILAASVVYVINTALVSVVLMLVERGSFGAIWKHWCLGSLPYYVLGAIIVGAAISAGLPVSEVAALLIAPSILLSTLYYRFWLSSAKPV